MDATPYDYRNCQSLFGYAAKVHERSRGVCQLCGSGGVDFNFWRQLTVEHLIGQGQGGYLKEIKTALAARFPTLGVRQSAELAERIDEANTVTACSFCNSTTSRTRAPISMSDAIAGAPDGSPDSIYAHVTRDQSNVLDQKQRDVKWKLQSVRAQFEAVVAPSFNRASTSPALDSKLEVDTG